MPPTNSNRWINRWQVPRSDGHGYWTVAQKVDGTWGCSCPQWKFHRRLCRHIEAIQSDAGPGPEAPPKAEPSFVLANVKEVTPEENGQVLVPLIPFNDPHFQATVCYDLVRAGFSWAFVRDRYELAKRNARHALEEYVNTRGRKIYGPWNDRTERHEGFAIVRPHPGAQRSAPTQESTPAQNSRSK